MKSVQETRGRQRKRGMGVFSYTLLLLLGCLFAFAAPLWAQQSDARIAAQVLMNPTAFRG